MHQLALASGGVNGLYNEGAISRGAPIYKWKTKWFIDTKINNKCGYGCYFCPKVSSLTTAILKAMPLTGEEMDAMIFGKNNK